MCKGSINPYGLFELVYTFTFSSENQKRGQKVDIWTNSGFSTEI